MPPKKIVNEDEVVRWFAEGRTYQWMVEEYKRKYGIDTGTSLWGNFRRRRGLQRRITRNDDLIPWLVMPQHRWTYPVIMLRIEARRRAGFEVGEEAQHRLMLWKKRLEEDDAVVHYDPDTEAGFFYVPRRSGVDTDLIRVPLQKTTPRPAAD